MKGEKSIWDEHINEEYPPYTEEEKAELLKKLTPGAQVPNDEASWAMLAARGVLKEAWEREKIPLPD